ILSPHPGELQPGMLSWSSRLKLNLDDFRWLAEIGPELLLNLGNGCFARFFFNYHFRPLTHTCNVLVLFFSENHIIGHTLLLDVSTLKPMQIIQQSSHAPQGHHNT